MSPVVDCTSEEGREEGIAAAVTAVSDGEVVVIPTDTVYGIGCDAFSGPASAKVLAAKDRGPEMPLPVLVGSVRTLDGLATDVRPYVRDLVREFWPGPLTIVVTAQPSLAWNLGDTNGTVALRMPDDDIALLVLADTGPLAVTSANKTGHPPATTVLDAATQLGDAVAVYVDGGPRTGQVPSTIVDCTGETPVVLREGAIAAGDVERIAGADPVELPPSTGSGPGAPTPEAAPDDAPTRAGEKQTHEQ